MPTSGAARLPEYRIFETDEFKRSLNRLGPPRFLPKKLEIYVYPQLKTEPHYGTNIRKLQGYSPDTWRYRIGPYRLFYSVNDREKIVFILTVDDRKDAYR